MLKRMLALVWLLTPFLCLPQLSAADTASGENDRRLAGTARAGPITAQGVEDRLIVWLKPGVPLEEGIRLVSARGLQVLDTIPGLRMILAQAASGRSRPALVEITALPQVWDVQRDFWAKWIEASPASFQETPLPSVESAREGLPRLSIRGREQGGASDPGAGEAQWGVLRVNAPAAWATNRGAGVKVAIVDTGIDPEHPDLKGRVAGGYNAIEKDKPWADDHFHGTHVAGIVAAELDGTGVVGVAPQAALYAVKVLTKEGTGSVFGIMGGIQWCIENGMQVVNMSLGAPQGSPFLQRVMHLANNAGVTIVAAAGNDGKDVNYPAKYPEAIAVSALCPAGVAEAELCPSAQEGIAAFSSRGPEIAVIAPGVKVPSSVPYRHDSTGVKAYSGTSMACPHVAGLAALAVARGAKGPDAVRSMLRSAAAKLPGLSSDEQGAGLIDAALLGR